MRNKPRKKHSLPSDIKNTLGVTGTDWNKIPMFGILTARSKSHLFNRHYNGIGVSFPETFVPVVKGSKVHFERVDHSHWLQSAKRVNADEKRKRNSHKERLLNWVAKFAASRNMPFKTREEKLHAIAALRNHHAALLNQTGKKVHFHMVGEQVMTRVSEFKVSMPSGASLQAIDRRNSVGSEKTRRRVVCWKTPE